MFKSGYNFPFPEVFTSVSSAICGWHLSPSILFSLFSDIIHMTLLNSHCEKAVLEFSFLEGCLKLFHQKWRVDNSPTSFQSTSYISDSTQVSDWWADMCTAQRFLGYKAATPSVWRTRGVQSAKLGEMLSPDSNTDIVVGRVFSPQRGSGLRWGKDKKMAETPLKESSLLFQAPPPLPCHPTCHLRPIINYRLSQQ